MQMLFQLNLAATHCFFLALFVPIIVIVLSLVTIKNGVIGTATIVYSHHVRRIIIVGELKRLSVTLHLEALEATEATKNVKTSCLSLTLQTLEQLV